jgi:hypothetical protein
MVAGEAMIERFVSASENGAGGAWSGEGVVKSFSTSGVGRYLAGIVYGKHDVHELEIAAELGDTIGFVSQGFVKVSEKE